MSEISKLYENAGIKGEWRDYRVKNGKVYNGKNPKNRNIRLCTPHFTAEKQLKMIKWLALNKGISINYDDKTFEWGMATDFEGGHFFNEFEQCLADLVNVIWQSLTEEEKEQIREILK